VASSHLIGSIDSLVEVADEAAEQETFLVSLILLEGLMI